MNTKTLVKITASILLSSSLVIVLFLTSFDFSKQKNDFLREFPPHAILERDTFNIKYTSYYIAGSTPNTIYLGNHEAPLHVLVINLHSADTQFVRLRIKNIETVKFRHPKVQIDSPYFYLTDGTIPSIYRGKIGDWNATRVMYDSAYFTESVPIGPSSVAIRSLSSTSREHVLGKESNSPPHVKFNPGLLQKQIDGVFCIDGMLHHNKEGAKLIYTYFYRNQFIVMDTSMDLIYRGKTIDTVSRAQIKVATIESNKERTLSAPPLMVNGLSSSSGDYLFINSKLPAENESIEEFENSSVIDVYNLIDGSYKLSFYIYKLQEEKMQEFKIINNKLIVLYNHYIITYDLRTKYFDNLTIKNQIL